MPLFLIHDSDGEAFVEQVTEAEVFEWLEGGKIEANQFADRVPDAVTSYWVDRMLLIRGEVVTPKPKEVYELTPGDTA